MFEHDPSFLQIAYPEALVNVAVYRNVRSMLMPTYADRDVALDMAEALLVERGALKPGDTDAITCGASRWATRAGPPC